MFQRILAAVDGSDRALSALDLAVKIQRSCKAELIILSVYRHHSLLEASMSMVRTENPEHLDKSMHEYASRLVEHAKSRALRQGAAAPRGFVTSGPPARTIVKFAKEHDVDLIVLGSRGVGDLEGFLLGSVSHKVTSLSECPTLVV